MTPRTLVEALTGMLGIYWLVQGLAATAQATIHALTLDENTSDHGLFGVLLTSGGVYWAIGIAALLLRGSVGRFLFPTDPSSVAGPGWLDRGSVFSIAIATAGILIAGESIEPVVEGAMQFDPDRPGSEFHLVGGAAGLAVGLFLAFGLPRTRELWREAPRIRTDEDPAPYDDADA